MNHDLNLAISNACQLTEIRVMLAAATDVALFFKYLPKEQTCLLGIIADVTVHQVTVAPVDHGGCTKNSSTFKKVYTSSGKFAATALAVVGIFGLVLGCQKCWLSLFWLKLNNTVQKAQPTSVSYAAIQLYIQLLGELKIQESLSSQGLTPVSSCLNANNSLYPVMYCCCCRLEAYDRNLTFQTVNIRCSQMIS